MYAAQAGYDLPGLDGLWRLLTSLLETLISRWHSTPLRLKKLPVFCLDLLWFWDFPSEKSNSHRIFLAIMVSHGDRLVYSNPQRLYTSRNRYRDPKNMCLSYQIY